jgi:hypothetical protein
MLSKSTQELRILSKRIKAFFEAGIVTNFAFSVQMPSGTIKGSKAIMGKSGK